MRFNYSVFIMLFTCLISCIHTDNKTVEKVDSIRKIDDTLGKRYPLLVSIDEGKTWTPATDGLPEDLQVSFIETKGNKMVIASDNMGLFLSNDAKTEWKAIGNRMINQKINALHISGNSIYIGGYHQGIFKTDDDGKTWTSLNYNLQDLKVQSILMSKDQLIVGTDSGIFLLDNETKLWTETNVKSQVLSLYRYKNKIVAGTSQGTTLSKDNGKTWNWIRKKAAVHYTRHIGQRIIELILNGDVIYSDDWGISWNKTEYQPRNGSYVYDIIEAPNYQIISNNYGIHRSRDEGLTWNLVYETESMAFFDLIQIDHKIYGGIRTWDEYRKRNN